MEQETTAPVTETPWYESFESPEVKEWVPKVGLKSPEAAAMKAYNLEKYLGADKAGRGMVLPKDDKDEAGWNNVYTKLGRPEKPDGYKLEGIPETALSQFHKVGLNQKQAESLTQWFNQTQEEAVKDQNAQLEKKIETELEELHKEWGDKYDENVEVARRASRMAGITEDEGASIVHALGSRRALEVFMALGKNFTENKVAGMSGQKRGFEMSREEALQKKEDLMRDKGWQQRYLTGGREEKNELQRLLEIINQ